MCKILKFSKNRTIVYVITNSKFGGPSQLLSVQGLEFESELFSQLMTWMEIDKLRTTAYKQFTNGIVERFHRTLDSMLEKVISKSQKDWDEKLP